MENTISIVCHHEQTESLYCNSILKFHSDSTIKKALICKFPSKDTQSNFFTLEPNHIQNDFLLFLASK